MNKPILHASRFLMVTVLLSGCAFAEQDEKSPSANNSTQAASVNTQDNRAPWMPQDGDSAPAPKAANSTAPASSKAGDVTVPAPSVPAITNDEKTLSTPAITSAPTVSATESKKEVTSVVTSTPAPTASVPQVPAEGKKDTPPVNANSSASTAPKAGEEKKDAANSVTAPAASTTSTDAKKDGAPAASKKEEPKAVTPEKKGILASLKASGNDGLEYLKTLKSRGWSELSGRERIGIIGLSTMAVAAVAWAGYTVYQYCTQEETRDESFDFKNVKRRHNLN